MRPCLPPFRCQRCAARAVPSRSAAFYARPPPTSFSPLRRHTLVVFPASCPKRGARRVSSSTFGYIFRIVIRNERGRDSTALIASPAVDRAVALTARGERRTLVLVPNRR